ncbi:MAG: Cof-type HAD-IIB family hydrolase [Muribaculaceae bacterium]|nr:Cof-type HAD-IIB family hydrolase [Muribaculaceae bacterium]
MTSIKKTVTGKTLYITDLDGTLLDSNICVSQESVEMLNRAIDSGALVSVATARTPATLANLLRNVRFRLPLIVMTGAALWHRDTNTYSDVCHFPAEKAAEILHVYREYSLPTFVYTLRENMMHIYHSGPLSDRERNFVAERLDSPYKTFHLRDAALASINFGRSEITADREIAPPDVIDDAILFFGMQPTGPSHPAFDALRRIGDINPMFYPDANIPEITMIEAFPQKASKRFGIRRLKQLTGADRVVVFGDNLNDIPMMEEADLAVAVDNALPEVKAKAHITIGNHNENAVAAFILEETLSNSSKPLLTEF